MRALIAQVWPAVKRGFPDAELHLYGDVSGHAAPHPPDVRPVGFRRRLESVYRSAAVVVNPIRRGTGLKIKCVEALMLGKALVTTSCGADGLEEGAGTAFACHDDMERFGAAIADLLTDEIGRRALEHRATAFARARFSRSAALGELLPLLKAPSAGVATASRGIAVTPPRD